MTIKKGFPLATALFLIASMVGAISAQNQPSGDGMPSQQPAMGGLRSLGLSEDQIVRIREINRARRGQMESAQAKVKEALGRLDDAIYSDQLDEAGVSRLTEELTKVETDLTRLRFRNELEIRRILTADQLVRFRDMRRGFLLGRGGKNNAPETRTDDPRARPPGRNLPQRRRPN